MRDDGLLTTKQAGDLLGLSADMILIMCQRGAIPSFRAGYHWKIPREELRRWAEEHGIELGKDELLQIAEAAAYLGISKKLLRYYIHIGKIPVIRYADRGWRFISRRALDNFFESEKPKFSGGFPPHTPLGPSGDINILTRKARRRKKPRKWSLYGEVREAIRQVLGHDPPPQQIRACLKAWKIRREGRDGLAALAPEKIIAIWREVLQKVSPRRRPKITLLWILYRHIPRMMRRVQERFEQALERYRRGGQPDWSLPRLPGEPNPFARLRDVIPQALLAGRREAQEAQANTQKIMQEIPHEGTPQPPKSFRDLFPADFLAKIGKSHAHKRESAQRPVPSQGGGMVQARACLRDAIPPEFLAKIGNLKPEPA